MILTIKSVRFIGFLSAAILLGTARADDGPVDWPQFLGPARDGSTSAKAAGIGGTIWKVEVGAGWAGPVVAEGKLVLFHRLKDEEVVDCFDAASGKTLWSARYATSYVDDFGFDDGPRSTPAIAGGRVFTFGAAGALHCWALATGKQLWAVDVAKDFAAPKGYFGFGCSPLAEGDAVILNIGGRDGAGIVAFDAATGKVRWKATDDAAGYSSATAATIDGRRVVIVLTRAGLVALEAASGKVLWRLDWRARMDASVNAATPLVVGDLIFVSASYGVGAAVLRFAADKPEIVWKSDDAMSNHYATCVQRDGHLYGFHGRQDVPPKASVRCVEIKTGKVVWSEEDFGAGTVNLAGDMLVILTERGELILAPASPDGYKAAAKKQILGFDIRAHPAIAGGMFYARDKKQLVCVKLEP